MLDGAFLHRSDFLHRSCSMWVLPFKHGSIGYDNDATCLSDKAVSAEVVAWSEALVMHMCLGFGVSADCMFAAVASMSS